MDIKFLGVIFALVAMFSWGLGDYFIQKVSREIGIWKALFFISIIGVIGVFPFVLPHFSEITQTKDFLFLGMAGFAALIASVFSFQALKVGKLSIMEPILSIELPIAVILAIIFWKESLGIVGWILIVVIFIANMLAAATHHTHLHYHKRIFEKGVVVALVAALCMALLDLLMGASSQVSHPLITVWFVWLFVGIISTAYLIAHKQLKSTLSDFKKYPKEIIGLGVFDTLGWVGFCLASIKIPISIATAIGQGYIIITILLGLLINREKLRPHQKWGVALAVLCIIILSIIAG